MVDNRKQAVSIRLGHADIRRLKRLSRRLGARDSDVIRFALKTALDRLAPLCDPEIRGRSLVPVFVEAGHEFIDWFELDVFRLEAIINEGVETQERVAHGDVALLAMSGTQQPYLRLRLAAVNADSKANAVEPTLRHYLYDKYVYHASDEHAAEAVADGASAPSVAVE